MKLPRLAPRHSLVLLIPLLIYAYFAWRYRLPATLRPLRANIGALNQYRWSYALWVGTLGLALHGCYLAGALWCWRHAADRRTIWVVWGGATLAGLALVAMFPVTSTDIFDYLFRGRIAAAYGKNPYIDLPNQFKADPLFGTIGWPNAPSAYGPLWELLSRGLATLGGATVLPNVLLHKALALATYLGCGALIWRIGQPHGRQHQLIGSYLWLWSPLALWEIVGAGHNDGLMVASVLLAVWAVERGHISWAVVALTVGTLFKFLPIILLPAVVVYGLRQQRTWRARLGLALSSLAIFAALTAAAYWPFWAGPKTFQNITIRSAFVTGAPLAVVSYFLRQAPQLAEINRLLAALHLPSPTTADEVRLGVNAAASGLLMLGLVWQLTNIWWRGRSIWAATFGLLLWYLTLGNQWFQPWYVLWLIGLVAIRPDRRRWSWLSAWALAGQASYLLQFFIAPRLGKTNPAAWSGQSVLVQSLYCVLIFTPPLVVWAAGALWAQKKRGSRPVADPRPLAEVARPEPRQY